MKVFKRGKEWEEESVKWGINLIQKMRAKSAPHEWAVLFQALANDVRGVVFESAQEVEVFMKHYRAAKKEIKGLNRQLKMEDK